MRSAGEVAAEVLAADKELLIIHLCNAVEEPNKEVQSLMIRDICNAIRMMDSIRIKHLGNVT